jgi:hypothetical protein
MRADDEMGIAATRSGPLVALRLAATVVHALPGLRLRLRAGDRVLVEVRPSAAPVVIGAGSRTGRASGSAPAPIDRTGEPVRSGWAARPEPVPVLTACAFRRAVARMHEARKLDPGCRLWGLDDERELGIDVGVRPDDRALAGGLYRVGVGEGDVHAFATVLSARRCREVLSGRSSPMSRHPSSVGGVSLDRDVATEVTVVHLFVPSAGGTRAERHPLLDDLLAACAVAEVEDALVLAAGR